METTQTLGDDIRCAAAELAARHHWRAMLAENIYWASCEAFVQSSLLAQFNLRSKAHVAAREREIERGLKPDLVIIDRADHDTWWKHDRGDAARHARRSVCRAAVEVKVVWTEGNAYGSAVARGKAASIADDLRRLQGASGAFERYLALTIAGFHDKTDGANEVAVARETVMEPLADHVEGCGEIVILEGYVSDRWKAMAKRAWCAFAAFVLLRVR